MVLYGWNNVSCFFLLFCCGAPVYHPHDFSNAIVVKRVGVLVMQRLCWKVVLPRHSCVFACAETPLMHILRNHQPPTTHQPTSS